MAPQTGDAFERLMRIGKWPCDLGKLAHPHFYPALQGLIWMTALGVLLGAGAELRSAVRIANEAAGVVVGKLGTAVATPDELA